ncbi:hypothetical protein AXG93_4685s1070 [Marchantia polymorpha subsp. ruderalis]|uniref:Uncharacterized protein n=1 Tax=Marchantia polymorpha subsp. ruderalis TaxID=1480154 RepID=A0A176WL74_MARPO|nr:hypothetical protein AXG93_4685s1070 [Marchantia polymorpha subsp. ruderalis]
MACQSSSAKECTTQHSHPTLAIHHPTCMSQAVAEESAVESGPSTHHSERLKAMATHGAHLERNYQPSWSTLTFKCRGDLHYKLMDLKQQYGLTEEEKPEASISQAWQPLIDNALTPTKDDWLGLFRDSLQVDPAMMFLTTEEFQLQLMPEEGYIIIPEGITQYSIGEQSRGLIPHHAGDEIATACARNGMARFQQPLNPTGVKCGAVEGQAKKPLYVEHIS